MAITLETVRHVARLARLELSDSEAQLFTGQLNHILAYVEKLNELDTEDVEPLAYLSKRVNALREDDVKECLPAEDALKNAPSRAENFFKVPKVIE